MRNKIFALLTAITLPATAEIPEVLKDYQPAYVREVVEISAISTSMFGEFCAENGYKYFTRVVTHPVLKYDTVCGFLGEFGQELSGFWVWDEFFPDTGELTIKEVKMEAENT